MSPCPDYTVSLTEFTQDPQKVLKQAQGQAVAVCEQQSVAFYAVPARLFEALQEQLEDQALSEVARQRLSSQQQAQEVDLDHV